MGHHDLFPLDVGLDKQSAALIYSLDRGKLRIARRRGRGGVQEPEGDLAIRPIFHKDEGRIEAHIFAAFPAYALQVPLRRRLHTLAPGLTARSALEKFVAV